MHAVGFDAIDAPGVGSQNKSVADAAFVDEFFVEFADSDGAGVSRIMSHIGDGAAVDEGHLLTARQRQQAIMDAIPAHARLQGVEGITERHPATR